MKLTHSINHFVILVFITSFTGCSKEGSSGSPRGGLGDSSREKSKALQPDESAGGRFFEHHDKPVVNSSLDAEAGQVSSSGRARKQQELLQQESLRKTQEALVELSRQARARKQQELYEEEIHRQAQGAAPVQRPYSIIIPPETMEKAQQYIDELNNKTKQAGGRLGPKLPQVGELNPNALLGLLLNTKYPKRDAYSVYGNGTDWNLDELKLLGDISVAVPVTIFDDGKHDEPSVHKEPFKGTLLFTPGALLANYERNTPVDIPETTNSDGSLNDEGYYHLYERRLLPVFHYINEDAGEARKAIVTIPGLGCGVFAGVFYGQLESKLATVLRRMLNEHGARFPNIKAVYFDPFDKKENQIEDIHGISFRIRSSIPGSKNKPQLSSPVDLQEDGDDFSKTKLYSVAAWDHVAWPGNSFYEGTRATSEGVKAAATDSMFKLTGVQGVYDPSYFMYRPPRSLLKWAGVVEGNKLSLWSNDKVWKPRDRSTQEALADHAKQERERKDRLERVRKQHAIFVEMQSQKAKGAAHVQRPYSIIIPFETLLNAQKYIDELTSKTKQAGGHLSQKLSQAGVLTPHQLLGLLFDTKPPQLYAESGIHGDGTDWNLDELKLLGDISVAVPVTIFDDGKHANPSVYQQPFQGTLVYTPGALLRNGKKKTPVDLPEVTNTDGTLNDEGYYRLYERRLLSVFRFINEDAGEARKAIVTIPGLGCGEFAGSFKGQLGSKLEMVLHRFLTDHGAEFPNIKAVYFDPFSELENRKYEINGISLMIRPLTKGNGNKPQLSRPEVLQDAPQSGAPQDDFSNTKLYSIVAWDHVSWPGNDFYIGSRQTDDGVKAAATDSMFKLTGVQGHYDDASFMYLPPAKYGTWGQVVQGHHLRLWNDELIWTPRN